MFNTKNVLLASLAVVASFSVLMWGTGESLDDIVIEQTNSSKTLSQNQVKTSIEVNAKSNTQIAANSVANEDNNQPEETASGSLESSSSYIQSLKAREDKNSYHEKLLKDHDRHNRYPEYNQRIVSLDTDPIERSYELDQRTAQSEDGEAQLTIWTDKKYYLHGDEVVIYAILEDVRGVPMQTKFVGQLIFDEQKNLQQFEFTDMDLDGVYEHRLTLEQEDKQLMPPGIYKVLIVNETNEMVNAVAFTLSQPELELTGNYQDTIDAQGSLMVQAEVEVTTKQRFYFQASLYSSTNDPIGVTQFSTELAPGRHWVPLSFDGLMIRDAGEPGPYLLKSISLAKVAFPIQKAPLIYPEFYTSGYTVDQFQGANYSAEQIN
jgi:hypothetical protein